MRKKAKLPFLEKPLSLMYHHTAFSLGIIQSNMEPQRFQALIATKFINCSFDENSKMNKFNIGNDLWFEKERIIVRYPNTFSRFFYDYLKLDVVHLLKKAIDSGYYPQGNYNEEWIPGKEFYKKQRFYHDFLLVGYNDIEKNFISVGYLKDGHFKEFKIPYDNMKKAIETLFDSHLGFDLLLYNKGKPFLFNLNSVSDELKNYIFCSSEEMINEKKYFGIKAIEKLISYIINETLLNRHFDFKYIRGFLEHKFFMKQRVEFFVNKGYVTSTDCLLNAKKVYEIAEKVYFLGIKSIMNPSANNINKMIGYMQETINIEKNYIPILIDNVKKIDFFI